MFLCDQRLDVHFGCFEVFILGKSNLKVEIGLLVYFLRKDMPFISVKAVPVLSINVSTVQHLLQTGCCDTFAFRVKSALLS